MKTSYLPVLLLSGAMICSAQTAALLDPTLDSTGLPGYLKLLARPAAEPWSQITETERFANYASLTFVPYAGLASLFGGAIDQALDHPREWGQGGGAYRTRVASSYGSTFCGVHHHLWHVRGFPGRQPLLPVQQRRPQSQAGTRTCFTLRGSWQRRSTPLFDFFVSGRCGRSVHSPAVVAVELARLEQRCGELRGLVRRVGGRQPRARILPEPRPALQKQAPGSSSISEHHGS